ncbi:MAG: response regulator [Candidatus Omnitrophica bacterium]|nr:response regulator [Candidatus Omnitrophota bacterium]
MTDWIVSGILQMMSNAPFKKILLVDDEEEVLTHVSNILRRANYEVISTTRGKEAVGLAINQRPDLIILDIVMPDMGGSEVVATLCENPSTANISIILLTGILTKQEEESLGKKAGKHHIMAKPITGKELLDKVREVLYG